MRRIPLSVFLLAPLVALGIYACDQGGPAEPDNDLDPQLDALVTTNVQVGNPLLGSWVLTSVLLGNEELMPENGPWYKTTFRSDFSFSTSVSNDDDHLICPTQTSCEWDGTYTYTATTIMLVEWDHPDPDERGEDTSLYALCGGKMFWLEGGDEDGGAAGMRATFQKTGEGR